MPQDLSRVPIFVDEAELAILPRDIDSFREELRHELNIRVTITTESGQTYSGLIMRKQ